MSRSLRIALLVGCTGIGALHLPAATQALSAGMVSPLREVRAMERAAEAARADDPREGDELGDTLAQRD